VKRLTLMRHAEALNAIGSTDRERTLSPRGREQAAWMGAWCHEFLPEVDQWLVSPAARTRETMAGLRGAWPSTDGAVRFDAELYLGTAAQLEELVGLLAGDLGHVFVLGHNPGISILAANLVRGPFPGLGTAGLVTVELDLDDWSAIHGGEAASWVLQAPPDA